MSTASPSPPIYRARYRATNVVHYEESALSSSDDDDEKDELVGVGLAFYAQIYVLKVPTDRRARSLPSL